MTRSIRMPSLFAALFACAAPTACDPADALDIPGVSDAATAPAPAAPTGPAALTTPTPAPQAASACNHQPQDICEMATTCRWLARTSECFGKDDIPK